MQRAYLQDNITYFPKAQPMAEIEEQENSLKEEGFTQTPNVFYDRLLGEINSLSEMKVTLALIRKIYGWHKEADPHGDLISFSQFIEITKLSRPMVKQGIDAGVKRGSIIQVAKGQSFMYRLNLADYQGEAPESKRGSKLEAARAARTPKRFIEATSLDNKPQSSLFNKPVTGLDNKHTKERKLNKQEINNTTPNGVGPTTIDLPDVVETFSKPSSRQVEAPVSPGHANPNEHDRDGAGSHIPHSANTAKKPRKSKPESPYTKDPRLLAWKAIAEENEYNYWPNRELQKMVYDHIPADMLPRWEFTIRDWLRHSHTIQNISGMVKVFWFGWDDFYNGKADKQTLPVVKQDQERELVHAST